MRTFTNPTTFVVRRTIGHDYRGVPITLTFTWEGGPYVDVARQGHAPTEVINVWDYTADEPRHPFTRHALVALVTEWIRDYGQASLLHDVTANW